MQQSELQPENVTI